MNQNYKEFIIILQTNPKNSNIHSDKGFLNIDNGSQGGTHWCCFCIKDNKSQYFDSFGG